MNRKGIRIRGVAQLAALLIAVLAGCETAPEAMSVRLDRVASVIVPDSNTHESLRQAIYQACLVDNGKPDTVNLAGRTYRLTGNLYVPEITNSPGCGYGESSRLYIINGTLEGTDKTLVKDAANKAWVTITRGYTTFDGVTVKGQFPSLPSSPMPADCTYQVDPPVETGCIHGINSTGRKNQFFNVTVNGHYGYGLHANPSDSGSIVESHFHTNLVSGISLNDANLWIVAWSTSNGNGENGIDINRGGGHILSSNTFANNGFYSVGGDQQGILLWRSAGNHAEFNQVYGNKIGILVYQGNSEVLVDNDVYSNAGVGIQVGEANGDFASVLVTSATRVDNNEVRSNGGPGIQVGDFPFRGGSSEVRDTYLVENLVYNNNHSGTYQVLFMGAHVNTVLEYNTVTWPVDCFPTYYTGVTFLSNSCLSS